MSRRIPIFILSKGRASRKLCTTPRVLEEGGIKDYQIVVEPQQKKAYAKEFGEKRIFVLPFRDRGLSASRTWLKEYCANRHPHHWQLDDDITTFKTREVRGKGNQDNQPADRVIRDCERLMLCYDNIGCLSVSGFAWQSDHALKLNQMVYSVMLIASKTPFMWRFGCIEDVDFSLQILTGGWCTILVKHYRASMPATLSKPGGEFGADVEREKMFFYRLQKCRTTQRLWPKIIPMKRKHGENRISTGHIWRRFKQLPHLVVSRDEERAAIAAFDPNR